MCRHYIIIHREPKAKPSATATGASKTKTKKTARLGDWGEQQWSAREKRPSEKRTKLFSNKTI